MRMGSSRPYHTGRSFTLIYGLRALASMLFLCLLALGKELPTARASTNPNLPGASAKTLHPPPPPALVPTPSPRPVSAPSPPPSPAPVPSPSPAPTPKRPPPSPSPAPTPRIPPPSRSPPQTSRKPPPLQVPSHSPNGKTLGIILVSIAGVLQAAVVAFLFVKRRQMLKIVRTFDQNGPSEN